jgi:hypothetical protein
MDLIPTLKSFLLNKNQQKYWNNKFCSKKILFLEDFKKEFYHNIKILGELPL